MKNLQVNEEKNPAIPSSGSQATSTLKAIRSKPAMDLTPNEISQLPLAEQRYIYNYRVSQREQWYAEVVRLCKEQNHPEWLYADKEAWLELCDEEHMSPQAAIDYQVECAI